MRDFPEAISLTKFTDFTGLVGIASIRDSMGYDLYLFSSHDIGFYLAKLCSDIYSGKNNTFTWTELEKCHVTILETLDNGKSISGGPSQLKLQHFYWHTQLSKNVKLRSKCPLNLTPHIRVTVKGIEACYRNKGYKSFVVGIYNNVKDAQAWLLKAQSEIKEGRLVSV